jgi:hypothetical protein
MGQFTDCGFCLLKRQAPSIVVYRENLLTTIHSVPISFKKDDVINWLSKNKGF